MTDTATVVIFDPVRLEFKLTEPCDWWSIPQDEVAEVNLGNVLFLGLGSDGVYEIEVVDQLPSDASPVVAANLINDSGRFFIGSGEWTTGDGLGPEEKYGNVFVEYAPGSYKVSSCLIDGYRVFLSIQKTDQFTKNTFTDSPMIAQR
jgi:hypothetical protein